ncbi:uncharacterized protein LOC6551027 [Drosophila erecta]|uniref:DUF4794 domain-containing protein n=1 Tax=Drosophila erecta TaxID=7220 RepID=B3NWM7_DROER|nr:uncharacterized protein LOC6551027 [Drosophila erecta]EDV47189.1 uncharacterized protein Dere_GG17789 [Drosophila erecta]
MAYVLSLTIFMAAVTMGLALSTTTTASTRKPVPTSTEKSMEKDEAMKSLERRDKRQLTANGGQSSLAGSTGNYPVFFDGLNVNPPLQPLPPLQQLQPLQPITVVTPVASSSNAQSQQPQSGWLPQFGQNLPLIGTWVGGLPNWISGLGLGSLNGGFGSLGGLNLGNLGNLGAVAPVASVPGQLVGGSLSPNPQTTCPLTQKLNCRCEPLIQLPGLKPSSNPLRTQLVQIMRQSARKNDDGSQEVRVILSSGHVIYQRTAKDRGQSGYLAMRIQSGRYFNIYYSVNEKEYTVRADVKDTPPTSDFDDELNGQL